LRWELTNQATAHKWGISVNLDSRESMGVVASHGLDDLLACGFAITRQSERRDLPATRGAEEVPRAVAAAFDRCGLNEEFGQHRIVRVFP
jgi:hypothetical protein